MRNRLLRCGLLAGLLLTLICTAASADSGPKPSVTVNFRGLEGETYFATLLSQQEHTGPASAGEPYEDWMGEKDIWEAFSSYEDSDGFYFLSRYADCSETHSYHWGYFPPQTFKVLLYFPEYDRFAVTQESAERYAFLSYFAVDADQLILTQPAPATGELTIRQTPGYLLMLPGLTVRLLLTLVVELGIAWLFALRHRKQLLTILWVNLVTQLALNLLLTLFGYQAGYLFALLLYGALELGIFAAEGWVYSRRLGRYVPCRHPWLYSLTANAASFGLGLCLARYWPGLF